MHLCDAHCDTLFNLYNFPGKANDLSGERLRNGGVTLQTMAMYVGGDPGQEAVDKQIQGMLDAFDALLIEGWEQAFSPDEAEEGKTKLMLSVEGGEVFQHGVHTIEQFARRGVRMATLTWNYQNALGTPHCVDGTTGLTPFGIACMHEMQRLHMAVDVSHLNDRGFWDVMRLGHAAPLASHSCARSLCGHTRNLTDEQLKALFEAGGFVGLNFAPAFLNESGRAGMNDILRHFRHMYDLGGDGFVGFGSDFDGISSKPEGVDNPEDFPAILEALRKNGFSVREVENIAGKAFMRYFAGLQSLK